MHARQKRRVRFDDHMIEALDRPRDLLVVLRRIASGSKKLPALYSLICVAAGSAAHASRICARDGTGGTP
jgi:hypothetical protein